MTEAAVSAKRAELAVWLREGLVKLGPTFIKIGERCSPGMQSALGAGCLSTQVDAMAAAGADAQLPGWLPACLAGLRSRLSCLERTPAASARTLGTPCCMPDHCCTLVSLYDCHARAHARCV